VVEADLPYNDSQMAKYGDHFAAWGEEDFSQFVGSLVAAIPISPLTMIVHHSIQQAGFVRRWLTTSSFKPVIPMYLHKIG
jgi:hypothetical protein